MDNLRSCCVATRNLHCKDTTEGTCRVGIGEFDKAYTWLTPYGACATGASWDRYLEGLWYGNGQLLWQTCGLK
jgi:hypothetical protein